MNDDKKTKLKMVSEEVVVVMVPFVAQGHLNPLLNLSRLISAYNIPVHFACTTTHNRQARDRLHGWNPNNLIKFHDFPDPEFTSPPPNPNVHFPTHLQSSFDSTLQLRQPVSDLIRSLSQTSRRVAVIHDSVMSYVVQDVKSIPNAETYIYRALSVFYYFCTNLNKLERQLPFDLDLIQQLPTSYENYSQEFIEFMKLQYAHQTFHVGYIYNSSRFIEGKFLESIEKDEILGKNHWAVGPFHQLENKLEGTNNSDNHIRHTCLQWLDKQPPGSVIYISFGTTTTFTNEQVKQLAVGLERSEQRFLWVFRDSDKGDVFGKQDDERVRLPEGFEERVERRGLVVRDWAPQVEILGHLSTGGFLCHSGWNSCLEAMTMGVAVAALPCHTDHPHNAFLLSHILGIGLVMRNWACRDELLTSVMVEKVVRKLMDTSEGAAIRKKAVEFGGELRKSMGDGGVTYKELNSLISYIIR